MAICGKIASFIKNVASGTVTVLKTSWSLIKNVFSGVAGFFTNIFSSALNGIKKIWENPGTFFDGVWKGIKGSFAT